MAGIKIDALGAEIAKMMEEYAAEVAGDVKAEAKAMQNEVADAWKESRTFQWLRRMPLKLMRSGCKRGCHDDRTGNISDG